MYTVVNVPFLGAKFIELILNAANWRTVNAGVMQVPDDYAKGFFAFGLKSMIVCALVFEVFHS